MEKSPQELCQQLMRQVSGLSQASLLRVCQHLGLPGFEDLTEREDSVKSLTRKVHRYLLREELEDQEDEGMAVHSELEKFLQGLAAVTQEETKEPLMKEKPDAVAEAPLHSIGSKTGLLTLTRREFKISGQIGEPGQRDRLTFSSLAHQIESGRAKGHSEREIVEAVIRAVVPGCALRSYLEGRSNLTLPSLRRLLRSHYQEKDATELYHQLSRLAQDNKESAQSFLVRALDLRQKVIFASQENGSGLKYDSSLVQSMFLHALQTGLRSDAVKNEIRPLLQDPTTTDEILFEKLNVAASYEAERQEKLAHPKTASVKAVEQGNRSEVEMVERGKTKQGTLMSDIAELKAGIAEIANLKRQLTTLQDSLHPDRSRGQQLQPGQRLQSNPRRSQNNQMRCRGCPDCQQQGNGDFCSHCYRCGSSEHFARGCRQPRDHGAGNDNGLLQRDEQ